MSLSRAILLGLLGLVIIAGAGAYYHHLAHQYSILADAPLLPSIPLENFPLEWGNWQGHDVPISETVLKVAGVDDYISRYYVNPELKSGVSLYVGYTAEPRRMLGHRPRVCYVGSGWIHGHTHTETLRTKQGNTLECLIHRFYKTGLDYEEVFVLNYYVFNGQLTTDHTLFDGLRWRRPKEIDGRLAYVAQVQISGATEQSVRLFAQDAADELMTYMP
ncbi:MAG: exosortase-associated EpsI family protein [Planctomycetes bacterium]|jgi:hypothetical protein|nr:exosortase-associated EpsI family protein [Planctomycetota bacterium]